MMNTTEIAHDLGLLTIPDGILLRPQDIMQHGAEQGRAWSYPARRASRCRRSRASRWTTTSTSRIEQGDTVVLSSRIIPGNEKAIYRMINHLARRGADVVYGTMNPPVHVSGHASVEELKLVLNLVRPRYFVPVHGEYRQLAKHATLAQHLRHAGPEGVVRARNGRDAGNRPVGRAKGRARHGRPRLHRFGITRRSGGGHRDSRPPASFRRRLRAADHRDQQAHGEERGFARDREPRICLARRGI